MNRKFKKFLSAVLTVVMVLSTASVMSYALEEGKTYYYDDVDDPLDHKEITYTIYKGKVRITQYRQPTYDTLLNANLDEETVKETIEKYRKVVIPESINGYEVGYIGPLAFAGHQETDTASIEYFSTIKFAEELVFPDTVFFIDDEAIMFCNLKRIVLPNNPALTRFSFDSNLGELVFPDCTNSFELYISGYVSKIVIPGNIKQFTFYAGFPTIDEFSSVTDKLIISEGVESLILMGSGFPYTIHELHLPKSLKSFSSTQSINIETLYYAGTRSDWSHIDPKFKIESTWKENGTEFVYKSIIENIAITPDVLEIYSGKSETLATTVSANTTDTNLYKVTYTSSDEDVAKVDENGKITAYGRGTATITCTVTDDNGHTVSDTCKVTVKYTFWRWLLRVFLFIIGVNSKI